MQNNKSSQTFTTKSLGLLVALGALVLGSLWFFNNSNLQSSKPPVQVSVADVTPKGDLPSTDALTVNGAEISSGETSPVGESSKIKVLKEILESKNDNDPRMDTELKNLTDQEKQEIIGYYHSLKAENRNGKGTSVFLIGRALNSAKDVEFLEEVLREEPCLSVNNCSVADDANVVPVDEHDQTQGVTLAYPQLVALHSIEMALRKPDPKLRVPMMNALKAASNSEIPRVRNQAERLLQRL